MRYDTHQEYQEAHPHPDPSLCEKKASQEGGGHHPKVSVTYGLYGTREEPLPHGVLIMLVSGDDGGVG